MSLFCFRIPSRTLHRTELSGLLWPFLFVVASQTFLSFGDFDSVEEHDQVHCSRSLHCNLSNVSLINKDHKGKVPFSLYHVTATYYQHDL